MLFVTKYSKYFLTIVVCFVSYLSTPLHQSLMAWRDYISRG